LGARRQRVAAEIGFLKATAQFVERRLSSGVHLSAPRAVAHFVRPFICEFSGVSGTKAAAHAQPEGFMRRIFFDPSLSFDPTTLESRSSAGAEALASPPKKWSAQLSYSPTMTEMDRRHKRSVRKFFRASV
jgi:hypothetical protein